MPSTRARSLAGCGIDANGLGPGADRAWPLTAEVLRVAWPLPDGTPLGPGAAQSPNRKRGRGQRFRDGGVSDGQ